MTIRGLSFAGCIAGRLGRLLGFRLPFAAGAAGLEVGEAGALLPDYLLVGQGLRFTRTGSILSFDVILGFLHWGLNCACVGSVIFEMVHVEVDSVVARALVQQLMLAVGWMRRSVDVCA